MAPDAACSMRGTSLVLVDREWLRGQCEENGVA
jgi:hypothetical protein